MEKEDIKRYIIIVLVALTTLALGLFIFNKAIDTIYKVELLNTPCELCVNLNPEWGVCYQQVTEPKPIPQNMSSTIEWVSLVNFSDQE